MSLIQLVHKVVASVNEADAKSRLPPEAQGTGVYSSMSVWHYVSENSKGNECQYCASFNDKDFLGSDLRTNFPDHLVISPTQIYANYHMTLWGKSTCYCYLWRELDNPSGLNLYNPETMFGDSKK